jgi:hypothetical protein
MTGPADVVRICGTDMGMMCRKKVTFVPPLMRRLAGSSAIDAGRPEPPVPFT